MAKNPKKPAAKAKPAAKPVQAAAKKAAPAKKTPAKKAAAAKQLATAQAVRKSSEPAAVAHDYEAGAKVKHAVFGAGVVREVTGDILAIEFKKGDVRFIREDFVKRA
ncbi:MAG: hypothetical protein RLZ98_1651 [Pseudomonadota bacterium]|jgi:hypothetical protein